MKKIIVYGAGGHGKVVADAAQACGMTVRGFCDDDPSKRGMKLLALDVVAVGIDEAIMFCQRENLAVALGVGSNAVRKIIYKNVIEKGVEIVRVIHPAATIARSSSVGRGTVIFAGAVVNPDAVVEEGVILNTGCSADHDNRIMRFAHLSPGVRLGGTVTVGEGTHVGIGARVLNNLEIGDWCTIGAGAVVIRNVPAGETAAGVPARSMRSKDGDRAFS